MKMNRNMKWVIVVGIVVAFIASVVVMMTLGGSSGYNYDGDYGYEEAPGEYYAYDSEDTALEKSYSKELINDESEAMVSGGVDVSRSPMPVPTQINRDIRSPISMDTVHASEWQRLIKKDATMRIKGENPYEIFSSARQKVISVGGMVSDYNESVSTYDDKKYQTITCTLSVPSDQFDSVMMTIRELGEIVGTEISSDDVTEEYIDLESRLSSKKKLITELNKFYNKAKNVEDSIDVYYQIQQVQEEVDQIEGRMKYLRSITSMSRIHMTISQPDVEVETSPEPSRFLRGLQRLWNDIQDGIVWFIGFLILMVFISIILFLLILLGLYIYNRIKNSIGNKSIE